MSNIPSPTGRPLMEWTSDSTEEHNTAGTATWRYVTQSARVRFLSIEPMLSAVDLGAALWQCCGNMLPGDNHGILGQEPDYCCGRPVARDELHWVICGGESGPHARPMHPAWVRRLRDQCAAAGVPFHFKQWGEWAPAQEGMWYHLLEGGPQFAPRAAGKDTHNFGDGYGAVRIGKTAAGRLLDGIEHNGFPL